jgi:hypothetical protein
MFGQKIKNSIISLNLQRFKVIERDTSNNIKNLVLGGQPPHVTINNLQKVEFRNHYKNGAKSKCQRVIKI